MRVLAISMSIILGCAVSFARADSVRPSEKTPTTNFTPPDGMVLIPAGEFQMGDSFSSIDDDYPNGVPVHAVYVSSFYMDQNLVTNQQYADALNWANSQGLVEVKSGVVYKPRIFPVYTLYPYCGTTSAASYSYSQITWSGSTFGVTTGKENYPMEDVSWYGSVAYANWRGGMQGRPLCYDLSTWNCNFAPNGYRLPTEAEWEKAARGGASGHRFPWSDTDTIQQTRANYFCHWYYGPFYSYDKNPTGGYHPTFNTGNWPYTSPVGYFAPNGYGLYDMAGNLQEWCNDWFDDRYYSSSPYSNPRGGTTQDNTCCRILRGGSWSTDAWYCRCSSRNGSGPQVLFDINGYGDYGLRLVSGSAPNPDLDGDGDVDQDDLSLLVVCMSGAQNPLTTGCESSDLDSDGDVDQTDFGLLQRCLSGPDIPTDLNCAN